MSISVVGKRPTAMWITRNLAVFASYSLEVNSRCGIQIVDLSTRGDIRLRSSVVSCRLRLRRMKFVREQFFLAAAVWDIFSRLPKLMFVTSL